MAKSSQEKLHPRNWQRIPLLNRSRVAPDKQRSAEQLWADPQKYVIGELVSLFKYRIQDGEQQP